MRTATIFVIFLILLFTVLVVTSQAQIHSASTSHEVLAIVSTETPVVKKDTIQVGVFPPQMSIIKYTLTYPKLVILMATALDQDWMLTLEWEWRCRAYTREGQRVMLMPDEEFAILEKLIPLTQKK